MLTLIYGPSKSGKTTMLLNAVQKCPAQGMAQRIIIVPEQLSHQTERQLSALCGDEISFVSEVLSFTRLGSRVCSIYGGGARKVLDQGGRMLTVKKAMGGIVSQLHIFAASAGKTEFLSGLVSMIDELKSYDVSPRRLMEVSAESTGIFSQKMRELSLMMSAYEAVTAHGAADPRDQLTLLRNQLRDSDYACDRHFFVDGFTDFTAQEFGVLSELLRKGVHMTVTIPCDDLTGNSSLYRPGRETAQQLLALAKTLGQETEILPTDFIRQIPEEFCYLAENLFTFEALPFAMETQRIQVQPADNPLEECRRCGAVLKHYAMQGIRYRDMAVCASDEAGYGQLLETVCASMGIPLYTSGKEKVLTHPAVGFLLLGLEAAIHGLETETVAAYLKTGYSGLTDDECDRLENYAITWAIRGKKWTREFTMHPDGYDGTFDEKTNAYLAELSRLRDHVIAPVSALNQELRDAENISHQIMAVYHFLQRTQLYEKLMSETAADTDNGNLEAAQETAQIWQIMLECLQQMADVLGDYAESPQEFLKIFRQALTQYEVGTIPSTLDCVSFGNISSVRGKEPKILCVLGVNDGKMPRSVSGGSLITERERALLRESYEIALAPDSEGAMERELFQIYSALTAPTEALYLFYSGSESGQSMEPAFLIDRVNSLFPRMKSAIFPETMFTLNTAAQAYLSSLEVAQQAEITAAISKTALLLPELKLMISSGLARAKPRIEQMNMETAARLFGMPVSLSASKLDALGNCPLSFFLDYGLKAKLRKEATFDAAEFGTFVHEMLEFGVAELTQGDLSAPISPEKCSKIIQRHMKNYADTRLVHLDLSPRQQYLYQRNGEEAKLLLQEISEELSVSDFVPSVFELGFGREAGQPALIARGALGTGKLTGFVDRVDLFHNEEGDFIRVIDYKTGRKTFDYTDLYYGVGMQMLLYLFTLERTGIEGYASKPVPAGVLYFPAKRDYSSMDFAPEEVRHKPAKRSGVVLGEQEILDAMEHGGDYQYLPVNGTSTRDGKNGKLGDYALTREQLRILEGFTMKRVGEAVDRILGGDFAPNPLYRGQAHDPCSYCNYKAVCLKDDSFRKQHYREPIKAADFWEKIGGEADG